MKMSLDIFICVAFACGSQRLRALPQLPGIWYGIAVELAGTSCAHHAAYRPPTALYSDAPSPW